MPLSKKYLTVGAARPSGCFCILYGGFHGHLISQAKGPGKGWLEQGGGVLCSHVSIKPVWALAWPGSRVKLAQ